MKFYSDYRGTEPTYEVERCFEKKKEEKMTDRDKTNLLMGLLGYVNPNNYDSDYHASYQLLKENDFNMEKIINLHFALNEDESTNTSFISLAGSYANLKIKMSEIEDIIALVQLYDVEIGIG